MATEQAAARTTARSQAGELTQVLMRQIRALQEDVADATRTGQALRELCDRLGRTSARETEVEPPSEVAGWTVLRPSIPAASVPPLEPSRGLGRLSDRRAGATALVVLIGLDESAMEAALAAWLAHAEATDERAVFLLDGTATAPVLSRRLPFEHLPEVPDWSAEPWVRLGERRLRIMLARWQPRAIYLPAGRIAWFDRLLEAGLAKG